MISKSPSVALAESPILGTIGLYWVKASFNMNIVSLAPESKKVGVFPFWKLWKLLLISAIGISSDGMSIKTPD
jgi:hypothetical protein